MTARFRFFVAAHAETLLVARGALLSLDANEEAVTALPEVLRVVLGLLDLVTPITGTLGMTERAAVLVTLIPSLSHVVPVSALPGAGFMGRRSAVLSHLGMARRAFRAHVSLPMTPFAALRFERPLPGRHLMTLPTRDLSPRMNRMRELEVEKARSCREDLLPRVLLQLELVGIGIPEWRRAVARETGCVGRHPGECMDVIAVMARKAPISRATNVRM
jgi:hypothetical protein